MGKEQPASYYDAAYKKAPEYSKPWQQSRYLKVWERMVQRFDSCKMVIDLGCGVGQTAEYLFNARGIRQYVGIDFSSEAIEKAKQRIVGPMFHFIESDLFNYCQNIVYDIEYPDHPFQFFCSETLEHIEKDLELLELLASKFPGSRIALSVPTFDDPGHVRHFKSPTEVKARYGKYIDCDDLSQIGPWIILQGRLVNS